MATPKALIWSLLSVLTCVLLAGCAAVKPNQEYHMVTQYVAEATGQKSTYRPDEEDAVRSRVEALLVDGLTLNEAIQLALLSNPAFQAAWMDVGMARADFVQSGLLSNPSLGGSLRFPAGGGLADLEVTMAQNVADLWQIPVRQRAAQSALDQVILRLARQAAELAADTRAAYARAAGTRELHKVALDNLAIARQLLDMAVGRQQAGAGSELDVNLSRSAVLEAELSVESARLAASEARRGLTQLLGLTTDPERIALSESLPSSVPGLPPAEVLIAIAREKRLDVRAAAQAVAQADARVREEYLKVFPTLELGTAMERAQRQAQPGRSILADTARASIANGALTAPEIQPRSDRRQNTDFIIGPSWGLELPVFNQNQAQIAKAQYARQQVEKTLQSVSQRMEQEVRSACDQTATAWRIVTAYRERFIPLAEKSLALSRESYNAGRASFLSVLESQRFFLDTRRRAIEAQQSAAATIPEVERAVGLPLADLSNDYPSRGPATGEPAVGETP